MFVCGLIKGSQLIKIKSFFSSAIPDKNPILTNIFIIISPPTIPPHTRTTRVWPHILGSIIRLNHCSVNHLQYSKCWL